MVDFSNIKVSNYQVIATGYFKICCLLNPEMLEEQLLKY